jgi:hypothetical protein
MKKPRRPDPELYPVRLHLTEAEYGTIQGALQLNAEKYNRQIHEARGLHDLKLARQIEENAIVRKSEIQGLAAKIKRQKEIKK